MNSHERSIKAIRVTYIGSLFNVALTVLKFAAGFFGGSKAMIADAVHSLSDFSTDIVVIVSFIFARKPVDDCHDYGHGKYETLAAVFVGVFLLAVGVGLIHSGVTAVISFYRGFPLERPGSIAIYAAIASIAVKEILYHYTKIAAKKLNSSTLLANAWHHRSDAFSSVGAMIGISGAFFLGEKWVILDPLAGIAVSVFVLKTAFKILIQNINELMEASLSDDIESDIMDIITSVDGVHTPHKLKTRKIGDNIAIDIHIMVERTLNIVTAHSISTSVEDALKHKYGENCFISVHVEPKPIEKKI